MQPSKETKSPALHSAVYMPSPGLIPSECSIKMKIPQQLTDYTKCFVFDRRSYNIRCIITHHFSFSLSFFGINLIIFLIIFVITRLLPIPQLLCLALAHQGKPFTMFHKMKKKKCLKVVLLLKSEKRRSKVYRTTTPNPKPVQHRGALFQASSCIHVAASGKLWDSPSLHVAKNASYWIRKL